MIDKGEMSKKEIDAKVVSYRFNRASIF